jgi:hypothetical protein
MSPEYFQSQKKTELVISINIPYNSFTLALPHNVHCFSPLVNGQETCLTSFLQGLAL